MEAAYQRYSAADAQAFHSDQNTGGGKAKQMRSLSVIVYSASSHKFSSCSQLWRHSCIVVRKFLCEEQKPFNLLHEPVEIAYSLESNPMYSRGHKNTVIAECEGISDVPT